MKTAWMIPLRVGGLLLFGLTLSAAGCSDHSVTSPHVSNKQTYRDSEVRNVDFTSIRRVAARTLNGIISLQGQASPAARLEIRKTVRARTLDEARQIAGTIRIEVEVAEDGLVIRSSYPRPPLGVEVEVDYDLACPDDVALDLDAVNGRISLNGMCGATTADLTNGRIEIAPAARPGGAVAAGVVNGVLAVDFPPGIAYDVTATTGNGCILSGPGGTVVDQCRSGGQVVHLGEAGGTPYELRVINGNIEINRQ